MPARASTPHPTSCKRSRIGTSIEGRPIHVHSFARGPGSPVLVLAGMHGDEPKSVTIARLFVQYLLDHPPAAPVMIVPEVNPDGYHVRRRRNAAGVDINRNFPTADWTAGRSRSRYYPGPAPASEPETRAIIRLVESVAPAGIISIHSISSHRQCNNYDGPGLRLARLLASHNGYPVRSSIGYPVCGSFGTWAGCERALPTVTLELPSHHSPRRCWSDNRDALAASCACRVRHKAPRGT